MVGWHIYELTHDKLALGIIGLAEALPFISVVRDAGHVADRHDKRRVSIVALLVLLTCSVALLILPFFVQDLTMLPALSLSSTALLIVVGVGLDTIKQLEAQLLMRPYQGFIK